jgi:hypothetical protein
MRKKRDKKKERREKEERGDKGKQNILLGYQAKRKRNIRSEEI